MINQNLNLHNKNNSIAKNKNSKKQIIPKNTGYAVTNSTKATTLEKRLSHLKNRGGRYMTLIHHTRQNNIARDKIMAVAKLNNFQSSELKVTKYLSSNLNNIIMNIKDSTGHRNQVKERHVYIGNLNKLSKDCHASWKTCKNTVDKLKNLSVVITDKNNKDYNIIHLIKFNPNLFNRSSLLLIKFKTNRNNQK